MIDKIELTQIDCPLCDCTSHKPVKKARDYVYDVPGLYDFVRCDECRHIYINPRPADESLSDCYPASYGPHITSPNTHTPQPDTTEADSTTQPAATQPSLARRILRHVPFLRTTLNWLGQQHGTIMPKLPMDGQRRLLEIGCAHGGYLASAADHGWTVDGIEPDDVAAQRARDRGLKVKTSTLVAAELPSESREAIVSWMVLEHVPDPVPFTTEAFRILVPGGDFAVGIPNGGGFERVVFGRQWLGYDAPRHLQVFTPATVRRLLHQAGFTNIKIIHQASVRYWWGSIAAWGMDRWPNAKWPRRWMSYFINDPPRWVKLLSLIPGKLISLLRCSGRITVLATKPE